MGLPSCEQAGMATFTNFGGPATAVYSNVSIAGGAALAQAGSLPATEQHNSQRTLAELFPNPARDNFTLSFPQALTGKATATRSARSSAKGSCSRAT